MRSRIGSKVRSYVHSHGEDISPEVFCTVLHCTVLLLYGTALYCLIVLYYYCMLSLSSCHGSWEGRSYVLFLNAGERCGCAMQSDTSFKVALENVPTPVANSISCVSSSQSFLYQDRALVHTCCETTWGRMEQDGGDRHA